VIEVARQDGPALLSSSVAAFAAAPHDLQRAVLHAYLVDIPLPEISGCTPEAALFLARATLGPVLESLDLEAAVSSPLRGEERRCPWCWGLPQCKTLREAGEYKSAVQLVCSRCARAWDYSHRRCGTCGEQALNNLAMFEASEVLPHLRIDGCRTCHTYMVIVDMRKEGKAEPLVDELCALPLDLWAIEQGFSKAQPNLLGV
jgi:formate dehydrogenase accessory protein FdhE